MQGGGYLCIVATMSYFAIPCFLMLTGAFLSARIENVREFYKKSLVKLGIPTLIFTVLYSAWYISLSAINGNLHKGLINVLRYYKTGWSGHPLWYMYMLVGLYAILPIVFKAITEVKINILILSSVFCIWAVISSYTSTISVTYNLCRVVLMLSYVVAGYAIKKTVQNKNNRNGVLLITSGIVFLIINGLLVYHDLLLDLNWRNWANNFSPFVMAGSLLIFAGFCKIEFTKQIRFTNYTFIIYLFHKGVLEVIQVFVGKLLPVSHEMPYIVSLIFIEVVVVFIISLLFSVIYTKVMSVFQTKKTIHKMNIID